MILRKLSLCGLMVAFTGVCLAQTLTMDEAIRLAKQNNGTFKAAVQDLVAAKARRTQASAAFLPTLTPSASYTDIFREITGSPNVKSSLTTTQADLNWQPLDSGQRMAQLRSARESVSAQTAQTQQTLRQLIFSVESQYLETLRAQELEKVADAQLGRANKVLDQTKTRVEVGDAAKREILQAEADALNAKVNSLNARNRTNTNSADLKAIIGVQNDYRKPTLEAVKFTKETDLPDEIAKAVDMGMKARPDLIARRKSVNAEAEGLRSAEISAGLTYSLDLTYSRQFSPNRDTNRNTSFYVSYPLFDGGKSQAIVTQQRASLIGSRALLDQAEKDARSEIEATFLTYNQDMAALEAAELALKAAQLNFEAAEGSQKAGAADLIDVITAQVSLVTAESNYIEATYDLLISQLKLRLVTGLPMPGEEI